MKSKKDTSPVRSRDKVIQSLYEIELSGSDIKELLTDLSLYDMSKRELEEYGRTIGIELDRRHSKSALIQELTDYLAN